MSIPRSVSLANLFILISAQVLLAQSFPTANPVIKSIWSEAMDSSRLEPLAHQLLDVIGPRLVGTPQMNQAHDWAVSTFQSWGLDARKEQWGTWKGWERGTTHIDLLEPRVRTLEGTMLAWSPPTKKGGVSARFLIFPDLDDSLAYRRWLPQAKGKFVLMSRPEPTGRPDENWKEFGRPGALDSLNVLRDGIRDNWEKRINKTGFRQDTLFHLLEQAGAAGAFTSSWSRGWGTTRVFGTSTKTMPVLQLSLEDYNLLYRLVEYGNNPLVRVVAESKFLGEMPTYNTIGVIPGGEKKDEYVILSAHFDSWESGSGATDNGTGSVMMMEVMRILRKYYPNPKRTILVGLWGSEEQGLNGSRAFVEDHPEMVENLQALFNQDNGTGRITRISAQGFLNAGEFLVRWLSRIPSEVTDGIQFQFPGNPGRGGSDYASFVAAGVPGFSLGSLNWDYFRYTWHTTRDTYDKLVFDELKNNVILAACLVYLASEDPETIPRDKRVMPVNPRTGQQREWPSPRQPRRRGGL